MNKKILLTIITLCLIIPLTGYAWFWEDASKADTAKLAGERAEVGETQKYEAELTEANHLKLIKAVPAPQLQTSQERKNLERRLTRFNDENKISYIYLISYGRVMAFYPIKGKVSSVNSRLTSSEQIVEDMHGDYSSGGRVIESPQLDGSYGTNGDAIFFFTADTNTYVEWAGEYMLVDKPLKLSTQPALIRKIK